MSNAATITKNKSILYSRLGIFSLLFITVMSYNGLYINSIKKGIGLYNGLFTVNNITQTYSIFILSLSVIILVITGYYSNKIYDINPIYNSWKHVVSILLNTISKYFSKKDLPNKKESLLHNNNYFLSEKTKIDYLWFNSLLAKNNLQFTIIEYSLIILFVLCGAVFLMSIGDLLSLFLSIELQSYGLYILSTIYRNSESATSSGLTYFLLGGLSSCFILFGSAILYVNSGTSNLDNVYIINSIGELIGLVTTANVLESPANYINFAFIILIVGLLFKISAAPFHFWSPDVYDGIPTVVTTFVAIIAKISLLILMLELVTYTDVSNNLTNSSIFDVDQNYYSQYWKNSVVVSSLMSLIIGSVLGLTQYRIKRLFAYSTISHVGFILLALSINQTESIQGYMFYILQYSLSNLSAFLILITIGYTLYIYRLYHVDNMNETDSVSNKLSNENSASKENKMINKLSSEDGTSKENKVLTESSSEYKVDNNNGALKRKEGQETKDEKLIDVENSPIQLLNQLKGYFHINPYLSLSFAITLFSFVGIPPLIGFFAKQMVLSAALDQGYVFMTLIGVITSVIGAAYYLNIVKIIFFTKTDYDYNPNSILCLDKYNYMTSINNENNLYSKRNSNGKTICINDKLSVIIAILTSLISLFIFIPDEWFRIVSILSFSIN